MLTPACTIVRLVSMEFEYVLNLNTHACMYVRRRRPGVEAGRR